jgi:hydroxypyruvate isomerase
VLRALEYATANAVRRIHVMSGMRVPGVPRERQLATLRDNIAVAAELASTAGITVLLEPINAVDVPGYLLSDTPTALGVLDELALPSIALQFDFYHQQIMAGDLARRFAALLPKIGHLQLADNPGRHEPGTGEIRYDWLLEQVAASDYDGFVGCEYFPSRDTASSLRWAHAHLQR